MGSDIWPSGNNPITNFAGAAAVGTATFIWNRTEGVRTLALIFLTG